MLLPALATIAASANAAAPPSVSGAATGGEIVVTALRLGH
jgi:hypothetical protein